MGYLTNFIVYTLAMVGVIVLALMVFKTSTGAGIKKGSKYLKVHDTLSLGPRKTLYIVSAGDEKFLIAGDVDKTTLISKLESSESQTKDVSYTKEEIIKKIEHPQKIENTSFQNMMDNLSTKTSYMDRNIVGIYKTQNKPYNSVMKNLAERMKEVNK